MMRSGVARGYLAAHTLDGAATGNTMRLIMSMMIDLDSLQATTAIALNDN